MIRISTDKIEGIWLYVKDENYCHNCGQLSKCFINDRWLKYGELICNRCGA